MMEGTAVSRKRSARSVWEASACAMHQKKATATMVIVVLFFIIYIYYTQKHEKLMGLVNTDPLVTLEMESVKVQAIYPRARMMEETAVIQPLLKHLMFV